VLFRVALLPVWLTDNLDQTVAPKSHPTGFGYQASAAVAEGVGVVVYPHLRFDNQDLTASDRFFARRMSVKHSENRRGYRVLEHDIVASPNQHRTNIADEAVGQ
jgi:hypothetical protein